jgi:eukaryotic-like serine/threonine-protein kinase
MRTGDLLAERFVLAELAGRGGMGEVYRAEDRRTGQPVAIKLLHAQGGDAARFEREACILADLDDPLVVRYVAHGALPSGELYLAMEWLEGEDLAARLARGPINAADSVALAAQLAAALDALHERRIIHRDLKPGNVFLVDGRLDRIKLVDFGLAWIDTATRMTNAGTLLGTMAYMAPEQARGGAELDARVDVFALGCLLFECLTGQPPFAAEHPTATLLKILFEDTPRLGDRLPGAPAALEALLARMLAKDPDQRPADGRAAAHALRALGELRVETTAALDDTVARPAPVAITDSEQRAAAVILIAAPAPDGPGTQEAAPQQATVLLRDPGLSAVVAEHGGRLQRLLDGSAAVLLSDSQVATDLAVRAARCALAMGAHTTGRRLALAMGRSEPGGRQPVGPAIDRAARLLAQGAAPARDAPGELILLDESIVGLLDARFDVRDLGGTAVLAGERDIAEVRTLLGKPTPCVGRQSELHILEDLLEDCIENSRAQAALVTAPPGMGKSRLGRELLQTVRARGEPISVWIARGELLRAGAAFGLLADLVHSACGLRGSDRLEVRQDKLRARVAQHVAVPDRQRVTEFLGELIGAQLPDTDSSPLRAARQNAQLMGDQVRAAFLDLLAAECAARPVLLLLEDLHWGDRPTVRLLDGALRDLQDSPLLVLGLARPEVHEVFPNLWAGRPLQEIRLHALRRKAAARLVQHVLGERASPASVDRIVQVSEGNAFYLEELIRVTAEGKGEDLPDTLVAMVQSRIGAFGDQDRRILRAASIFGETFWAGGVATLLGAETVHAGAIVARLDALAEKELIQKRKDSRFPRDLEYAFRHALVREGAYAMLTPDDRVLGHRFAGEWLEARGDDNPVALAEHFEKGGDGGRAASHYLRASDAASSAGDSAAAIAYGRSGLACGASGDVRTRLLGVLCEAHFYQFDRTAEGLPYAQELVQRAPLGDVGWSWAMAVVLRCAILAGRFDELTAKLDELRAFESSEEVAPSLTLPLMTGVLIFDLLPRLEEASAILDRLGVLAQLVGERAPMVSIFWHVIAAVRSACVLEEPETGIVHGEVAEVLSRALGNRRFADSCVVYAAVNRWLLGANDEAERAMKAPLVADEEYGYGAAFRPFSLAWLLADRGAFDEARAWALRLVASGKERQMPFAEGRGHWALAEVLRRAGELDAADAELKTAFALLESASPVDLPGAFATLAALRLAQGRTTEALTAAEQGMAKYQATGTCGYFFRNAFLRLVHAECLDAAGLRDEARAAIASARDWLLSVAQKIRTPSYRTSFLENVPENRRTLELTRQWLGEPDPTRS